MRNPACKAAPGNGSPAAMFFAITVLFMIPVMYSCSWAGVGAGIWPEDRLSPYHVAVDDAVEDTEENWWDEVLAGTSVVIPGGIGQVLTSQLDEANREKPITGLSTEALTKLRNKYRAVWVQFKERGIDLGIPQSGDNTKDSDGHIHLWDGIWVQNLVGGSNSLGSPWGGGITSLLASDDNPEAMVFAVTGESLLRWDIGPFVTGAPLSNQGLYESLPSDVQAILDERGLGEGLGVEVQLFQNGTMYVATRGKAAIWVPLE
jgi:hypothetical protein